MRLIDYLKECGETNAQFAKRAGLSEPMVSLLCRGHCWISRETAWKIFRATEGQVTPNDFLMGRILRPTQVS